MWGMVYLNSLLFHTSSYQDIFDDFAAFFFPTELPFSPTITALLQPTGGVWSAERQTPQGQSCSTQTD